MSKSEALKDREIANKRMAIILALFFAFLLLISFLIFSIIFTWADWVALLIFSLLLITPAYISNASMVITGGGRPIDRGRSLRDGRRILGDHKTVRGLFGPLYIGIPISFLIFLLFIILWQPLEEIIIQASTEGQYILYNNPRLFQYYFIGGEFPMNFLVLLIRIVLS
ncbi:MAG: CDP-archaeol synthase, partial [Promethearchaeota archaeon]